jgi:hypothetical protein
MERVTIIGEAWHADFVAQTGTLATLTQPRPRITRKNSNQPPHPLPCPNPHSFHCFKYSCWTFADSDADLHNSDSES